MNSEGNERCERALVLDGELLRVELVAHGRYDDLRTRCEDLQDREEPVLRRRTLEEPEKSQLAFRKGETEGKGRTAGTATRCQYTTRLSRTSAADAL